MDDYKLQSGRCEFAVANFRAELRFFTTGSASFEIGSAGPLRLGKTGDSQMDNLNAMVDALNLPAFHAKGWLDIHHPCGGHVKAMLRINLPDEYLARLTQKDRIGIVRNAFSAVGIPPDETFEARFFAAGPESTVIECVDRDGMTDRL